MYIKQLRWEIKPSFDGIYIHSELFIPKITFTGIGQLHCCWNYRWWFGGIGYFFWDTVHISIPTQLWTTRSQQERQAITHRRLHCHWGWSLLSTNAILSDYHCTVSLPRTCCNNDVITLLWQLSSWPTKMASYRVSIWLSCSIASNTVR